MGSRHSYEHVNVSDTFHFTPTVYEVSVCVFA